MVRWGLRRGFESSGFYGRRASDLWGSLQVCLKAPRSQTPSRSWQVAPISVFIGFGWKGAFAAAGTTLVQDAARSSHSPKFSRSEPLIEPSGGSGLRGYSVLIFFFGGGQLMLMKKKLNRIQNIPGKSPRPQPHGWAANSDPPFLAATREPLDDTASRTKLFTK